MDSPRNDDDDEVPASVAGALGAKVPKSFTELRSDEISEDEEEAGDDPEPAPPWSSSEQGFNERVRCALEVSRVETSTSSTDAPPPVA
jgi:hypothetical protein